MTVNIGNVDRMLRAIIGLILIVAPLINMPSIWSSTGLTYGSIVVGVILLATAVFQFCPLYRIVGLSTWKT